MAFSYKRAASIFRMLGRKDANALAKLEARKNNPYVARLLFLRAMWSYVIGDDHDWEWTARDTDDFSGGWYYPNPQFAQVVKRLLAHGIDPRDLTDVVREAQIITLFNVSQLLDNAAHGIEDLQAKIPENVEWRLVEYNGEERTVGRLIEGLHEAFHNADPTGRGGSARKRTKAPKRAAGSRGRRSRRPR